MHGSKNVVTVVVK